MTGFFQSSSARLIESPAKIALIPTDGLLQTRGIRLLRLGLIQSVHGPDAGCGEIREIGRKGLRMGGIGTRHGVGLIIRDLRIQKRRECCHPGLGSILSEILWHELVCQGIYSRSPSLVLWNRLEGSLGWTLLTEPKEQVGIICEGRFWHAAALDRRLLPSGKVLGLVAPDVAGLQGTAVEGAACVSIVVGHWGLIRGLRHPRWVSTWLDGRVKSIGCTTSPARSISRSRHRPFMLSLIAIHQIVPGSGYI